MTDLREGQGRDKKDRGLFASARKLARAAVTRAIERLTGMPLSGDPWATRGLLDDPATRGASAFASASAPDPIPAPMPMPMPTPTPMPAAQARKVIVDAAAPMVPMAPASATTVKVAAPPTAPVTPVAPARAGTVPGIGPAAPTPARVASASTPPPQTPVATRAASTSAATTAAATRPVPPPAPPIVMTPRAASSPRPATGGLPSPAPGKPAPLPTNGSNSANGSRSASSAPAAAPAPEPEVEQEPLGILDFEETPETYGVDECAVIARDPNTLFVYWEVTPGAWDRARGALGGDGVLTLRLFVSSFDAHGHGHDFTHDTRLTWDHGRRYVEAPARNAKISVAVGLLGAGGRFVAMAYGPPTLVPSGAVAAEAAEEWMDVAPAGPPGTSRVPPRIRAIGTAEQVAAQMAASGRASRRAAGARAGAATGTAGRGRLLPSGLYEFDEEIAASSWPTSRSRAAGGEAWPSSPSLGSSPSPTSPGKVRS
jgi:hypothetical protein